MNDFFCAYVFFKKKNGMHEDNFSRQSKYCVFGGLNDKIIEDSLNEISFKYEMLSLSLFLSLSLSLSL